MARARSSTSQCAWPVTWVKALGTSNTSAPAQGGVHENGRHTWGQSLVADPWGQVLAQQAQGPGVVLADLDPERLRSVRQQLPALTHRVL